MKAFSAQECVGWGWNTFKKRPWFLIMATIVFLVLTWIATSINADRGNTFIEILALFIAGLVLQTFIDMGLTAFILKAGDNVEKVTLGSLWHPQSFWSFLAASFITGVLIVLGLIVFIVPG